MTSKRDVLAARVHDLLESGAGLRAVIEESAEGFNEGLDLLAKGVPVAEVLSTLGTAGRRIRMTEQLAEFERSRHHVRLAITDAALDEGMTTADIGRTFGVSRQLASKIVKELRSGTTSG